MGASELGPGRDHDRDTGLQTSPQSQPAASPLPTCVLLHYVRGIVFF